VGGGAKNFYRNQSANTCKKFLIWKKTVRLKKKKPLIVSWYCLCRGNSVCTVATSSSLYYLSLSSWAMCFLEIIKAVEHWPLPFLVLLMNWLAGIVWDQNWLEWCTDDAHRNFRCSGFLSPLWEWSTGRL
jgi:hypothetical protein